MSAKKQKFELPPAIVSSSEDDAPTSPNHDLDEQSESRRLSFGSAIVPSRSSFMSAIADSVAKEDAIAAKKSKAAPSSSKKNAAVANKDNEQEEDEQPPRKSGKSKDGSTAAAASSSEKGKKKTTGKVPQEGQGEEEGQRAECIIGNLPSDLKHIYATTLRRICPEVRTPYPSQMIEDNEDITFVFEIQGKANAKRLRDRIKARQLFGRQVTVDIIPEEKLKCEPVPFAVDICAVPAPDQSEDAPAATPGGRHAGAAAKKRAASSAAVSTLSALQIEPALTGMPGFLAVVDSNEHMPEALAAAEDVSASKKKASKKRARGGAEATTDVVVPKKFIATFADEGSALHAKAVLSGRRQEGHFLFLNIRRE